MALTTVDVITELLWDSTPLQLEQVAAALIDRTATGLDETIDDWLISRVRRLDDEQPDRLARLLQQLASHAREAGVTFGNQLPLPLKLNLRELVEGRTLPKPCIERAG